MAQDDHRQSLPLWASYRDAALLFVGHRFSSRVGGALLEQSAYQLEHDVVSEGILRGRR